MDGGSTLLINPGERYVKFHLSSKAGYFEWSLVSVDTQKGELFSKLVHMCDEDTLPMLAGGDFNIIRWQQEKYKDNFIPRWPFIFNPVIDSLELREIALSGRQFILKNRRQTSIYEKLDQVLCECVMWIKNYVC
jgi:hypothetical protein